MTAEEDRLKAAGWKQTSCLRSVTAYAWTQDGIDWYTEDEALVVVLTAERDAAIARAEAAEALAASRPEITPEDARDGAVITGLVRAMRESRGGLLGPNENFGGIGAAKDCLRVGALGSAAWHIAHAIAQMGES